MASLLLLEDDDNRALEDAIAFLDAWHSEGTDPHVSVGRARAEPTKANFASSPCGSPIIETDGSASSPPPTSAPLPVKASRMTTDDKRKEEIRLLRQEAAELHTRFELLRQLHGRSARDRPGHKLVSASGLAKRAVLAAMWKDVAVRQKKLRAMSEAENAGLRSEVADQEMMLKAIRSMLKRRKRKSAHMSVSSAVIVAAPVGAGDFRLLEQLCDRAEAECFPTNERLPNFTSEQLAHPPVPQIAQLSDTKIRITFRECRAMPFAFVDLAAVLWDAALRGCAGREPLIEQSVTERNGAVVHRCREECQSAGQSYKLNGIFAARPRRDFHRVGYVFGGLLKPFEINGKPASGISMSNRGAMVISSILDSFCQLEAMFHVEIDLTPSLANVNAPFTKGLADAVARANVDRYSAIFALIESMMLSRPSGRT